MTDEEKIKNLEDENVKLKERLIAFKQLEEELLTDKVFKKAKEKLVSWYTIGGIALFVVGIVGIKSIIDYSKDLVSKKLESFSEAKINEIIMHESHKQVEVLLIKQQDTLSKQFQILYDDAKKRLDLTKYGYGSIDKLETSENTPSRIEVSSIDLSSIMNGIRDQGNEGSNVGFTLASALEYSIFREDNLRVTLSPRYIYNNINHKLDAGAIMTDGLVFLNNTGAVEETIWPYKAGDYAKDPPRSAVSATHYKISGWKAVKADLNTFKGYLSEKKCIIAGMAVYQSLYTSKNGVYLTPKMTDQLQGGLSICLVGFDDNSELIKFRISWGSGWGDKGYGYIKYSDISKLITDAYIINLK